MCHSSLVCCCHPLRLIKPYRLSLRVPFSATWSQAEICETTKSWFCLLEIPLNHCCMFVFAPALIAFTHFVVLSLWYYSSCLQVLSSSEARSGLALIIQNPTFWDNGWLHFANLTFFSSTSHFKLLIILFPSLSLPHPSILTDL